MLLDESERSQAPEVYWERRREIAAMSTGPHSRPVHVDYTAAEHATWSQAMATLLPVWERNAAEPVLEARATLDLPRDEIPQLSVVSDRLMDLTGFRYASVPGTVSAKAFFGALANRTFSSTQFIRWSGDPLYTPEPDVLHEVGGHAVALANPQLAELHQLAGRAAMSATGELLDAVGAVFWYTVEFGVLRAKSRSKAYGAGLLSSPSELGWFEAHADIRSISIPEMIATPYDISHFQPVLFGADSLEHVLDVAGTFFADVADLVERRTNPTLIDLRTPTEPPR